MAVFTCELNWFLLLHIPILRRVQSDVTELNWQGSVYDELTSGRSGQTHWSLVDAYVTPTPLDGAYCNALLLANWSVHQKLNHLSSEYSLVTSLCTRFLRARASIASLAIEHISYDNSVCHEPVPIQAQVK